MKKIYMIISAAVLTLGMNAQAPIQVRTGSIGHGLAPVAISSNPVSAQATGDTLMYTDGGNFYVNPTDQAAFQFATEDDDGLALAPGYASAGYSMDWGIIASTTADGSVFDMYQPWEVPGVDTALTFYATSWFSSPGIADNWMMMGPITIPATGGQLIWREKCNPGYRDGYSVLVGTSASSPPNAGDFGSAQQVYSRTDLYPSTTQTTDTVWVTKTVSLPSFTNGQTTWFAWHHTANDMDVLYIDEILVLDFPTSVAEANANAFTLSNNVPNPANGSTTFNYTLKSNSDVTFNVYDVTGKVVFSSNEANQSAGAHRLDMNTSNLSNGMYFYTITVNGQTETRKMTVANN
jgi:hypothetical protein